MHSLTHACMRDRRPCIDRQIPREATSWRSKAQRFPLAYPDLLQSEPPPNQANFSTAQYVVDNVTAKTTSLFRKLASSINPLLQSACCRSSDGPHPGKLPLRPGGLP